MVYIIESMVEAYGLDIAKIEAELFSLGFETDYAYLIDDVPFGSMYHDGISIKKRV